MIAQNQWYYVNTSFMLCEFLLFSLQSTHLYNMKQNGYQNAAFECFTLMPFYDIVSFTAATAITGYRNSSVSFCNTALLLISEFFPAPLANQKKARYNMTKRTEMVIFQGGCDLGFYRLRD